MTEQEAIDILKGNYPKTCRMVNGILKGGFDDLECEFGQAITMGISALEEILKYREIGTKEECKEAREKQKAKRPDIEGDGYTDDGQILYDTWVCPSCGEQYEIDYDDYDYCPKCGQHIKRIWKDWGD